VKVDKEDMVEEIEAPTSATALKNRKKGFKRGRESKKMKVAPGMGKKNKINKKMQKLFRKRAREYNSDDDGDDDGDENVPESTGEDLEMERNGECQNDDNELGSGSDKEGQASDDEDEVQTGITKFVEGCKAFRVAFHKIMKRHVDDETLVITTGAELFLGVKYLFLPVTHAWGFGLCRVQYYQHIRSLLWQSLLKKMLNGRSRGKLRRKSAWYLIVHF